MVPPDDQMSETLLTQRLADTLKRIRAARSCDQIRAMDIAVIEDAITALQSNTSRSQTETTEGLTPRTDALKARIEAESKGLPYETILHKLVGALSVHSRQLERELAIDAHELDERRRFMGTDLQDVYDRAEQAEAKLAEALRDREATIKECAAVCRLIYTSRGGHPIAAFCEESILKLLEPKK